MNRRLATIILTKQEIHLIDSLYLGIPYSPKMSNGYFFKHDFQLHLYACKSDAEIENIFPQYV